MVEKIELLIITEEIGSGIYEFVTLFDYISKVHEDFSYKVVLSTKITADDLNNARLIWFNRSRSVLDYRIAKLCQQVGKSVALFLDDDFLSLKNSSFGVVSMWPGRKRSLIKMLSMMDLLISTNDLLLKKYGDIGAIERRIRIDTVMDIKEMSPPILRDDGVCRFVMYVNDASTSMFDSYVLPFLKIIKSRISARIELYLLALNPDCSEIKDHINVIIVPHMQYPAFKKYMSENRFDFGLAPLDECGFNRYKYFNKYIEYTRAGVMGIYSDCSIYRQVVSNGINGALVKNIPEEWADTICFYYNNPEKRINNVVQAQKIACDKFSKDAIADRIYSCIRSELSNYETRKICCISLIIVKAVHYFSRVQERIYLLCEYFRHGGFKLVYMALSARVRKDRFKNG